MRAILNKYWVDILFVIINLVLGVIGGTKLPVTNIPWWWFPTVLGIVGTFIGTVTAALFRMAYQRKREEKAWNQHRENVLKKIDAHHQILVETRNNISLIKNFKDHSIGFEILSKFVNQLIAHITKGHEFVTLESYLQLLNWSLERATTRMFATSLVKPKVFLANREVMDYLVKQASRIKESELKAERVFIGDRAAFDADASKQEVIEAHKKNGITIGFCEKDALPSPRCYSDFVFFESDDLKWVVEAGDIAAAASKELPGMEQIRVQLHLDKVFIDNNWTTTINEIRGRTEWF
jgi:uncharacterized membrane protein YeaQ/YmgE (transglycosylase-associated protein family)